MKLVFLVLLALAAPPAASAAVWPVLYSDFRIGHYRVKSDGTLRGAVAHMGQPDTRTRIGRACELRWRVYGARMRFTGSNACGVKARFARAVLVGRQWSTASRLGIGASASTLRERHPLAFPRRRTEWWWLVRRAAPDGFTGLEAKVHLGRVTAFRVTYGAGAS